MKKKKKKQFYMVVLSCFAECLDVISLIVNSTPNSWVEIV